MRLIDADEFQKQIAGMAILNNYPPNKANALCELVDNQPTAFDVWFDEQGEPYKVVAWMPIPERYKG